MDSVNTSKKYSNSFKTPLLKFHRLTAVSTIKGKPAIILTLNQKVKTLYKWKFISRLGKKDNHKILIVLLIMFIFSNLTI